MIRKDQIIRSFASIIRKIGKSFNWKDFLIFLFFLVVSSTLWFMRTLRKDFDMEVRIPLEYVNQPPGYVQTLELPDYISVRVSDRGTAILGMKLGKRFSPIPVDMRDFVHRRTLVTSMLAEDVQLQLNSTSVIRGIYPDSIHFRMLKLEEKTVPVKLAANVELERQYMLCDSIQLEPQEVTVYAPRVILDTIKYAVTEDVSFAGVKDTLVTKVHLKEMPGVSYSVDDLKMTVKTEQYTEKYLEVPIYVEHLPAGLNLRLFPSYVDLSFYVGISQYDKVDASSFSLFVDYKDVLANEKSLKVKVAYSPKGTFHLNMTPAVVDFLVEAKQ